MFAIIKTGGKQYKVAPGDVINVEKLDVKPGSKVEFDCLMMSDDKDVQIGTPLLETKVKGKVVEHGKGKKVIVFHYKPKKNIRKKNGHRQLYTRVEIQKF
ncbi:MAG: 50S ribosomal protein L21 [Clostridia bacterium]|nr:50S ribosomal protein L21 [Clostridia bacterium]